MYNNLQGIVLSVLSEGSGGMTLSEFSEAMYEI